MDWPTWAFSASSRGAAAVTVTLCCTLPVAKMNVDGFDLLYLHNDAVHDVLLEPGGLSLNRVFAGKHVVEHIGTGSCGLGCDFHGGVVVDERDRGLLYDRAGRIFHRSRDLSSIELSCQACPGGTEQGSMPSRKAMVRQF